MLGNLFMVIIAGAAQRHIAFGPDELLCRFFAHPMAEDCWSALAHAAERVQFSYFVAHRQKVQPGTKPVTLKIAVQAADVYRFLVVFDRDCHPLNDVLEELSFVDEDDARRGKLFCWESTDDVCDFLQRRAHDARDHYFFMSRQHVR